MLLFLSEKVGTVPVASVDPAQVFLGVIMLVFMALGIASVLRRLFRLLRLLVDRSLARADAGRAADRERLNAEAREQLRPTVAPDLA